MIAQYFEHECEKFLFFNAVDNETYEAIKGEKRPRSHETAAAKAGDHWEELIIELIKKMQIPVFINDIYFFSVFIMTNIFRRSHKDLIIGCIT